MGARFDTFIRLDTSIERISAKMIPPDDLEKSLILRDLGMWFRNCDRQLTIGLAEVHHELGLSPDEASAREQVFDWAEMAGRWPVPRGLLDKICCGGLARNWQELLSTLVAAQALIGPESLGLKLICVPPDFDPYRPWDQSDSQADLGQEAQAADDLCPWDYYFDTTESEMTGDEAKTPDRRPN